MGSAVVARDRCFPKAPPDPPEHRDYRSITAGYFAPRAIESMRPQVRQCVDDVLGEVDEASNQPFAVAPDDPEYQREPGVSPFTAAVAELMAYFADLVAERRRRPTSDVMSVIANATLDDGPVPDLELQSYLALLIVAGNETARNAISGGLIAMIENPGEMARLQAAPNLLKPACEEIVRYTSPLIQFARTANRNVEVHGQQIS